MPKNMRIITSHLPSNPEVDSKKFGIFFVDIAVIS